MCICICKYVYVKLASHRIGYKITFCMQETHQTTTNVEQAVEKPSGLQVRL